ncbi:MAG: TolC family protein [Candidatus Riflebacteria bacterium]|nr:TolC family protein [Candidatus Riflebacteria bacterium]
MQRDFFSGSKSFFLVFIATFFWITGPDWVCATQPESPSKPQSLKLEETLPSLITELFKENPQIRASREKILASKERISIEKTWPDPMLGLMLVPNPTTEMEMINGAKNFGISQMIPLAGKKKLAGHIAGTRVEMEKAQFQTVVLSKLEALKNSYEEITYLDDAIKIISENRKVLDRISEVATSRTTSPAILSEIQRIQTQLSQAGYDEAILKELRVAEQARINSLLNRPIDRPLSVASIRQVSPAMKPIYQIEPPVASLTELLKLLDDDQPDLHMAALAIQMAKQEKEMSRKERVPDITVGYSQQRDRNLRVNYQGDTYRFDLNFPIWEGKNRAKVREAEHKTYAAEAEKTGLQQNLASDITAQYVRTQTLWRTIRIYEDSLLPQSQLTLENSLVNRSEVSEIIPESLEAQAVRLNFLLAYRRAIADYRQAQARMVTLLGSAPEIDRKTLWK